MTENKISFLIVLLLLVFVSPACRQLIAEKPAANAEPENAAVAAPETVEEAPDAKTEETNAAPTSNAEKIKPAAGKGNLQGRVLYGGKPAEGIDVTLCEKFTTANGIDCKGKTFKAKTDRDGVYVFANVEPKEYEGMMARVYATDTYIYPQQGFLKPLKINAEQDKTIFVRDINLFKDDLKIIAPKTNSKIDAKTVEMKWEAYPEAAYYKVNIYSDDEKAAPPQISERVDGLNYKPNKPLTNGKYRLKVQAFNDKNRRLAESDKNTKFIITGGEEPAKTP
jgi:hypothetical protein